MTHSETGQFTPPDYLEALSLYCAPYENALDPRFFYASTALTQRLDLLAHLTQFGESVAVVAGPPGSGKTTLMSRFVSQANRQWRLCLLEGAEIDQLPVRLSETLGVEAAENEKDTLAKWAVRTDASQLLVLVIDDAERLDQNACARLCDMLAQPQGDRVRIVLFGQQDILPPVQHALDQCDCSRSVQLLEIPRLSVEETASYLMYRLAVAGYSGESPFTTTEVRAICKAADGRPADINRLADGALQEQHARARTRTDAPKQKPARRQGPLWLSAALGVLLVAGYVGWQRMHSSLQNSAQGPGLAKMTPREEIPLELPASPSSTDAGSDGLRRALSSAAPLALETPPAQNSPAANDGVQLAAARSPQLQHAPVPVQTLESATTVAAPQQTAENQRVAPAPEALQPPAAKEPPVHAPADKPQVPAEQEPVTDLATTESGPASDSLQVAAAPAKATDTGGKTGPANPHRENWLLQQSARLYSLQLLGTRSEKSVLRFITDNGLDLGQTAYYRGTFKDSEWFVLLYGLYSSRDEALKARERLPAAVRKGKPWPRSLESVHSAIREMGP